MAADPPSAPAGDFVVVETGRLEKSATAHACGAPQPERSVVYGLATLWTMVKYLLHRSGLVKYPQFSKTLPEVISRYHWAEIARVSE